MCLGSCRTTSSTFQIDMASFWNLFEWMYLMIHHVPFAVFLYLGKQNNNKIILIVIS